jgi:hypothetical protein
MFKIYEFFFLIKKVIFMQFRAEKNPDKNKLYSFEGIPEFIRLFKSFNKKSE